MPSRPMDPKERLQLGLRPPRTRARWARRTPGSRTGSSTSLLPLPRRAGLAVLRGWAFPTREAGASTIKATPDPSDRSPMRRGQIYIPPPGLSAGLSAREESRLRAELAAADQAAGSLPHVDLLLRLHEGRPAHDNPLRRSMKRRRQAMVWLSSSSATGCSSRRSEQLFSSG